MKWWTDPFETEELWCKEQNIFHFYKNFKEKYWKCGYRTKTIWLWLKYKRIKVKTKINVYREKRITSKYIKNKEDRILPLIKSKANNVTKWNEHHKIGIWKRTYIVETKLLIPSLPLSPFVTPLFAFTSNFVITYPKNKENKNKKIKYSRRLSNLWFYDSLPRSLWFFLFLSPRIVANLLFCETFANLPNILIL